MSSSGTRFWSLKGAGRITRKHEWRERNQGRHIYRSAGKIESGGRRDGRSRINSSLSFDHAIAGWTLGAVIFVLSLSPQVQTQALWNARPLLSMAFPGHRSLGPPRRPHQLASLHRSQPALRQPQIRRRPDSSPLRLILGDCGCPASRFPALHCPALHTALRRSNFPRDRLEWSHYEGLGEVFLQEICLLETILSAQACEVYTPLRFPSPRFNR